MSLSRQSRIRRIRIAYFSPLPAGILSLFLGLYPHLFFASDGTLYESVSFFGFLENIRATCLPFLSGEGTAEAQSVYFAWIMTALWVLACFLIVWYALFVLCTTLLATVALEPGAASPRLNFWKKCYRMVFFGDAVSYVLLFVPVLLSCLPYLFAHLYRTVLGQSVTLYYDFFPDVIPLAVLSVAACAFFLVTRRDRRELRMDLFRLYK